MAKQPDNRQVRHEIRPYSNPERRRPWARGVHDSHDVFGTGVFCTASVVYQVTSVGYAHPEHGSTQRDTIRKRDPSAGCAWNFAQRDRSVGGCLRLLR